MVLILTFTLVISQNENLNQDVEFWKLDELDEFWKLDELDAISFYCINLILRCFLLLCNLNYF